MPCWFRVLLSSAVLAQVQALQVNASTGEVARAEWLARSWQTDGGLHDNNVTGIAQSADGYLWVATLGSLMRFDGSRFEEFSTVHIPKVPSRGVRRMFLGRGGRLWLATDRGGLIRVDEKSARVFTAEDGLYNARVACMAEDQIGALWVVCGSAVCRIQGDKVEQIGSAQGLPEPEGGGSWLTTDGRGQLWFARGTQVGVLRGGRWEVGDIGTDARILDAGCGEGVLVEEFQAKAFRIDGLDLNYESARVRRGSVLDMP